MAQLRSGAVLACALALGALACSGGGDGPAAAQESAAAQASCRTSCIPKPVEGLTSIARSTGAIVLTWSPPPSDGCPARGYRVQMDGRRAQLTQDTVIALTDMAPGATHTFSVASLTDRGLSPPSTITASTDIAPDLGANVHVFDATMDPAAIQAEVDAVAGPLQTDQFGTSRVALLFKPGTYPVDVPVNYYMQVAGLGALPGQVQFTKNVHSEAAYGWQPQGDFNATQNFWRTLENFTVTPLDLEPGATGFPNTMRWAVSQACPFRRVHVKGNMHLHHWWGWASGGWMADSRIDGTVVSGSQQQWISRNSAFGTWDGVNWNHVFVGDVNPFQGAWPAQHTTVIEKTPIIREKPFLHVDDAGRWRVFVPGLQRLTQGTSWSDTVQTPGRSLPIDDFFVAWPSDSAAVIDAALDAGLNLLLTPGIYHLDGTIKVEHPGTVVLGLGLATLHPDTGLPAMTVADVSGVTVSGVLFDAGTVNSPVLLRVGARGSHGGHARNPTVLHDLFFRVGGAEAGKADVGLEIDSDDVIVDHTWIWRADHGAGVGWTENPSVNGLVVNGDDVTIYGLFSEHFEGYQSLFNGERARVYFCQSEIPYDVPNQAVWMSHHGTKNGYASYKVAGGVTAHEAWGLGVYSVFLSQYWDPGVTTLTLDSAIEVPSTPHVKMHNMVTFGLAEGTIENVVNDQGGPATSNPWQQGVVVDFPVP
jgi:hypothetical protein